MPKPKSGESKKDFLKRCIPIVLGEDTSKSTDQAVAICSSIYDDSKKNMSDIKGVEVFGVGTWNGFKFVQEDLEEIISNTAKLQAKRKNFKPKVKLGHSNNQILEGQSDGDPALGFMANFMIKGSKILSDFIGLPKIIFDLIKAKRFTSVSIELDHIQEFGWYIQAVALLGADIPAVKTLQDLQVFLSEAAGVDLEGSEAALCFSEPIITKKQEVESMTPEEKARMDALEADNKKLTGDLETANKGTAAFKEQKRLDLFETKKAEILKPFSDQVKGGKLTPASLTKIENALNVQKVTFSEDLPLQVPVALVTDLMSDEARLSFKETGENDNGKGDKSKLTPDAELEAEIKKVQASGSMNYTDASKIVMSTKPEVYNKYVKWTDDVSRGRAS